MNPIEQNLNKVGPAIDRFIGGLNFPGQQTLVNFGREQEKRGLGSVLELSTPFGFLASPFVPNTQVTPSEAPSPNVLQQFLFGIPENQRKYTVDEAGEYQARPTAVTPEDRAYEQEKSRALQLAEQDQLAKKYQVADLTKQYNSASTPEEKQRIGLQIWATTNPQLAQSVSPRQVGYEQAQAVVEAPKDDKLDQTQKALLKQAFRRQLNK